MGASGSSREPALRTAWRVLRRRKRIVAFFTLLAVGAALGYSVLQTPVYAASADVVLRTGDPGSPSAASREEAGRAVRTEILIIKSTAVRSEVRNRLGFDVDVSARQVGDTDVIRIRAESSDPARAVQAADAYAATYVELRQRQLADELARANNDAQSQVANLDTQLQTLPPGAERDRVAGERAAAQKRVDDLQRDSTLTGTYVKVSSQAAAPSAPVRPRTMRNVLIGLITGLLLGLLVAAVAEALDDSVSTAGQLETALRDIPVLAVIPAADAALTGRRQLLTLRDPDSSIAESYRRLRAALQYLARDRPMQTVQITSPNAMQGKTTTAANLGVVLAQAGLRVVVVGGDLRKPRLHELFGLVNEPGFTSVLAGETPLSAAIREESAEPNLAVLPSGPLPANPSEVLASQRTVEVLTSLQAAYDVVLLDTPPVLAAADSVVLSRRVDATIIVSVAEVTTRKDATRAAEALRLVDAPLVGAVLHGSESEATGDVEPDEEDEGDKDHEDRAAEDTYEDAEYESEPSRAFRPTKPAQNA